MVVDLSARVTSYIWPQKFFKGDTARRLICSGEYARLVPLECVFLMSNVALV